MKKEQTTTDNTNSGTNFSPILNGLLSVLPFGKILANIKQFLSKDPKFANKNISYIITYVITGVILWLLITGKITKESFNNLLSQIGNLI